ncbi:hypothetical protein DY000_02012360 [Brassica cretica]|uniref:Uncharacterized protein n=1 Tax=Brassica cretica TaxID=69181 RepID=A0ABQ7CTX8_BRACR|nr:hypothetical protein DY000_02012360 [Brassica cretica]
MDPPDKNPDPDILKLSGYPIRSRPSCRETHRNHHRSSTQITTDPPPINPSPIETTTDPPPIIQTTTDPPPIETTTVRSKGSKPPPIETTTVRRKGSKPPPIETTTVSLSSRVLRDRGRIETHHQWKSNTKADDSSVPRFLCRSILQIFSVPRRDVVGIVAKLSKLSEVTGAIEAIDVTDPENKNGFYSGSAGSNEADQRRVTWKCLKLVLIASPAGVKTAKAASANKPIVDKEAALKFQTMCSIKEKDLGLKERLSKMDLLNNLISKNEPLSEKEEALKTKLLTEMLDN